MCFMYSFPLIDFIAVYFLVCAKAISFFNTIEPGECVC